jgi:hypothetical protein
MSGEREREKERFDMILHLKNSLEFKKRFYKNWVSVFFNN